MIKISKHRQNMNKKGLFFTVLAIALLSLFLASYGIYSFSQNRESIDKRIKTMNSYVSSLETDIPRKLYISGYRIIFIIEEKLIKEGSYATNLSTELPEAFFNGTLYGEDYVSSGGFLYGATFPDIVNDINKKASRLNINVSFINPGISISQDDPWHVKVSLDSNLIIEDRGGLVRWNRTSAFYTYIPIANFEDPLYTLNTNAKVVNKFIKTNHSVPFSAAELASQAENSYYVNHTDAPSFLKRLEGDFSADENGIESLVNTPELSGQGVVVSDKCIIDYVYFDDANNPPYHIPGGASSWIKICDSHSGIYG